MDEETTPATYSLAGFIESADRRGKALSWLLKPGGTTAAHAAHGTYSLMMARDALAVTERKVSLRGAAPAEITESRMCIPLTSIMWVRTVESREQVDPRKLSEEDRRRAR